MYGPQQLASHTNPSSNASRLILYSGGTWAGNYSGNPLGRVALLYNAADSASPGGLRPGGVAAYTQEFDPSIGYTGGGGGEFIEQNLVTPFLTGAGYAYTVAVTARNGDLAVAMYQASQISQTNEQFYRKDISGNIPVDAVGSTMANQGQLVAWFNGEANVAPTAPTSLSPSGEITTRTPSIQGNFNDANKTLQNGVAWDEMTNVHMQLSSNGGSTAFWDKTDAPSSSERDAHRSNYTYNGPALSFYTTYHYRIRHMDRAGVWGAWSGWTSFSVKHANTAPTAPTSLSPTGNLVGTQAVSMVANFNDADLPTLADGQAWERIDAKQTFIRRVSDNALIWDSGVDLATSTEISQKKTTTAYTLPAWDVQYRWYIRHRDRSGAWSPYASTTVTALSGAAVDKPLTPTGRVTSLSAPGNITAVYRNSGGLAATAWTVGLFNSTGALIKLSGNLTGSVAANGTITVTWANSTFGTLASGTAYDIAVKAQASNGQWSFWSAKTRINTNAAPTTPVVMNPSEGAASPNRPLLTFSVSDADATAGTLTVSVEVLNASDVLLGTYTAAWNAATGRYQLQTTSTHLAAYETFRTRAYAYDGFLYSGGSTTSAAATRSALRTFVYAAVPAVTITAPAGPTISTSQPIVTWTCADQTHWRVQLLSGGTVVYDTGEQASTTNKTHTIQATQYWIGSERWNNNEAFDLVVVARDTSTLWGTSAPLTLTVVYAAPATLIPNIEAMAFSGVEGTHYVHLWHDQSTSLETDFLSYDYYREELTGLDGVVVEGTKVLLARGGSLSEIDLFDFDVTSNQWYQYTLVQRVQSGVDVISSAPSYAVMMVSFWGTLLHMPYDPLSTIIWLPWSEGGGDYNPGSEWISEINAIMPMNASAPVDYIGSTDYVQWSGSYGLIDDSNTTAAEQYATLYRIWRTQKPKFAPDGRPHNVCWREGRGGPVGRVYGRLVTVSQQHDGDATYAASVEFEERHHIVGLPGGV